MGIKRARPVKIKLLTSGLKNTRHTFASPYSLPILVREKTPALTHTLTFSPCCVLYLRVPGRSGLGAAVAHGGFGMQIPDLTIWYGPDTYMGENLYNMLTALAEMTDEQIREVHPQHDQASVLIWCVSLRLSLSINVRWRDCCCCCTVSFGGQSGLAA